MTNHLAVIIITRFVQGVGFAALLNLALLINSELFPSNKQGLVLGISITLTGLGQAMGPTLAGVLLTYFSWHSLFIFNVPLSLISFILICLFYHIKHERHEEAPIIALSIFKIKAYQINLFVRFVFMYCWTTVIFFMPIYLQNYRHDSPLVAGCIMLAMTFYLAVAAISTGHILDHYGSKMPMIVVMLLELLGVVILVFAVFWQSLPLIIIGLICFGVYCGAMLPATIHAGIQSLPINQKGVGMGVFFAGSFMFAATSVAVASHLAIWVPSLSVPFGYLLFGLLFITLLSIWVLGKLQSNG